MTDHPHARGGKGGVMDASYASGRRRKPHLVWRYRTRALAAVEAFVERRGRLASPRVLEIGCAEGLTLLEIRRLLGGQGTYDGIDLSAQLLEAAPPLPSGVRLLLGDAAAPPAEIGAGAYDLCVALAVLEHLPDPGAAVRAAFCALAPGGVFVATCPAPAWDRIASRLRLLPGEHHEQDMDRARLLSCAREAGFTEVEHRPFMWAPVAFLPYAGPCPPPAWALRADAVVRRLRALDATFVNQALIAVRPV